MNGENDFCFHWSDAKQIAGFATEAGLVISGFGFKGVNVFGLTAHLLVGAIDLDIVLEPKHLRQWITAA